MTAAAASTLGSIAQVRSARTASGVLPAASSRLSRPPATLLARSLLSSAAQAACSGALKMGQTQAIFIRWCSPAAAADPGQNGRNVWSVLSTASPEFTWAASGYTPNVVMARLLAGILTDQSRTAPGARVPGSRARALATGTSTLGRFPAAYSLSSARLVSRKLDDQICTVRPDTVLRVVLLTVPCTVTARPGSAICGFTDVIPTVTCCAGAAAVFEITVRARSRRGGRPGDGCSRAGAGQCGTRGGQRGERAGEHAAPGQPGPRRPGRPLVALRWALTRHAGNAIAVL